MNKDVTVLTSLEDDIVSFSTGGSAEHGLFCTGIAGGPIRECARRKLAVWGLGASGSFYKKKRTDTINKTQELWTLTSLVSHIFRHYDSGMFPLQELCIR